MQKHYLLVEDRAEDALLMKKHLSGRPDVGLHWVMDGEEAVRYLEKRGEFSDEPSPDLIVLNLTVPGMGGFGFLEWYRGESRPAAAPVMIVTMSRMPDDLRRAEKLGVRSYLTKPVNWDRFEQEVSTLISDTGFDEETVLRVMGAAKPQRRKVRCVLRLRGGQQVTVTAAADFEGQEVPFRYEGDTSMFRPFAGAGTLGFFNWYVEAIAAHAGADFKFFED
jgi:CheY-like chemotaxis protein